MSHLAVNLMVGQMNQPGGMKTANTEWLVALHLAACAGAVGKRE